MNYGPNTVLVAGFAQFPKGNSLFETQKNIGCILIVNVDTHVIEEATFTFLMETTNRFAASLLKGRSLAQGIDSIVRDLEKHMLIPGQRALIQSFCSAYERYCEAGFMENSARRKFVGMQRADPKGAQAT